MANISYKQDINLNKKIQNERRIFLKKVKYVAPALVVLGTLTKPTQSNANPLPPSAPAFQ